MRSPPENSLQNALKACRSSFVSVGFFSLFINALMLVPTFYMLQVYGRVITSGSLTTLAMLTLIMTGLVVTLGSLEWVRSRIMVRVSTRLDVLLSRQVYKASFKRALESGGMDASAQSLNDLTGLRQFLTGNGLFAFFDAPWLPIYIAVMFLFHPWFGWVAIGSALLLLLLAFINEKLTGPALAQANKEHISATLHTTKNLRNAEVIESMGMLETLMDRWARRQRNVLFLQAWASDRGAIVSTLSRSFRILVQSLILGLGAYLAVDHQVGAGMVFAGSVLLGRALAPIDLIIGSWKGFIAARSQYGRLSDILGKQQAQPERMSLPAPQGHVQVENLIVAAPGSKTPIIKNMSFSVPAGCVVGIIGPSAAGKSTLARALMGVWVPLHGVVRLDGADISAWDKHELGPYIGYLPQDIELFEGSISENIARFAEVDSEKVVLAARSAGVHEMILMLPDGYDTVIGSDGFTLSAGQRQRVGLARALYGNPRLIILDEPNSNLDDVGDRALAAAIQQLKLTGATVFVITHRTNIVSQLDRLMVMNGGAISLYGPRKNVLDELNAQQQQAQKHAAQAAVASTASVATGKGDVDESYDSQSSN
ncbi:lipid A ABC transporter ATP-binding protein/permease MsbA [Pseudomonas sp. FW306-02-F02-AA]|uniref:Peptidase n=1 Tax=Pseudomonas fluorescens TaxID=294 RepID=A0A0N9WM09_PSEFL|nr:MULTISPECIES: type I secretion system permease/ATPase [Pseudomonas]ALI03694.1 peptidase [Pseudomonas fluorescens]PMZ01806.1 lipid A ABC transporter ATP-binding protein/permease MsbA [Pseudomonas sp. FW306-02-F02-AB]PMZ06916.1 lipid A ABC transporter ATP-binding protein/permease MsbA [Pseudomonas sp. FW306-02-H06C]PMZ12767.1 lipid A ABC transporter ATP-binding protein/permease MsbA [Pseudomonas sp. FW306-02-F02-AA]PMZ19425.1 lipid A ABC transporter ATP-binding protein/permease MsbA [Pseudomo